MTDQWVPAPPQPPAPDPPPGLPPANTWSAAMPCAASDSPSIVGSIIITDVPATIVAPYAWGITLNDGGSPPNFSIDHFDNAGALIESPIVIEGSSGDVMLNHDPMQPLGAATKDYVDSTGLREAPMDNTTYGRDNGAWVPLPASYMPEAPNTSQRFGRYNSIWQPDAIQTDAPSDGAAYARQNGGWTAAVTGGPYMPISGGAFTGVVYFPSSNSVVINGPPSTAHSILGQVAGIMRWQMQIGDTTAEGVGNAGSNFSLTAMGLTGSTLGTWLTIARADGATTFGGSGVTIAGGLAVNGVLALSGPGNFAMYGGTNGQVLATNGSGVLSWATRLSDAPSDGQFYTRQNAAWAIAPGGMTDAPNDGTAYARKSAAWAHLTHTDITDWTATLAPYALTTAVPVASTTTPAMDGTAAVGAGTTWARADHVHPSDTSRYAASNPSGYQTAAQVTASLASYLPLVGGTLTGALNGTSAAFTGSVSGGTAAFNLGAVSVTNTASGGVSLQLGKSASGQTNQITSYTGVPATATLRWNMALGDGLAESGSNAGSNFSLTACNDAGAVLSTPLQINRASGQAIFQGLNGNIVLKGASQPALLIQNNAGTLMGQCYWQSSTATVGLYSGVGASSTAALNGSGQWQTATHYNTTANAYMVGNTLWQNTSDERIKNVVGEYTLGLDEVLRLRPIIYTFKGNDTWTDDLARHPLKTDPDGPEPEPVRSKTGAAPYPGSHHHDYAVEGREFVGFVAQEVESILPGAVSKRKGFIDGVEVADMRDLNLHELLFALVNSVKTLAARIETLEAKEA